MQNRISSLFSKWALAIAILVGCSRSVGSESNFVHSCKDNTDCSAGTCVAGECKVSTGGAGGATGMGGAGARVDAGPSTNLGDGGRQGNGGGCSAAGAYTVTIGSAGAGAQQTATPTCPVDADGVATVDQPTFCEMFRCPQTAAELLTGLTCTEATTDHDGVTITSGCGVQTVTIAGDGFSYSAHFNLGSGGPVAMDVRQKSTFGNCAALAYRTGQAPAACASDITYKCRPIDPTGSGYSGCRKPGDPGCGTCCSQNGPWCNINGAFPGAVEYDTGDTTSGPCPCNCAACASCSPDIERALRTFAGNPVCDCSTAPDPSAGGAGGGPGDLCAGYCPYVRACKGMR